MEEIEPPDEEDPFEKADKLYDEWKAEESLVEYTNLLATDTTGWALFMCGRLYDNPRNDKRGIVPRDERKAEEFYTQAVPLLKDSQKRYNSPRFSYALGRLLDYGQA